MNDKNELDLTDTFVSYNELSGKLDLRETAAQTRREAEARADKKQNSFGATTGIKVYPFVRAGVSWTQRVLGWLRLK